MSQGGNAVLVQEEPLPFQVRPLSVVPGCRPPGPGEGGALSAQPATSNAPPFQRHPPRPAREEWLSSSLGAPWASRADHYVAATHRTSSIISGH